jgi:hypothetical protein
MQELLKEELMEAQQQVAALTTQCEGLEVQAANSERLTTGGETIAIDTKCAECDRTQKQMLSTRQQLVRTTLLNSLDVVAPHSWRIVIALRQMLQCQQQLISIEASCLQLSGRFQSVEWDVLCDSCDSPMQAEARDSMLLAQQESENTKIQLRKAKMELEQAAAKTRTEELRQEHTASLQDELSKARKELQELLQDNKSDELTRLQQQLSAKRLECTRQTVRFKMTRSGGSAGVKYRS